ncbi:MAG TPA: DUF6786 family protein [Hanamia sp.]|nr:DUF6786 family protein [Hanamia sp.]
MKTITSLFALILCSFITFTSCQGNKTQETVVISSMDSSGYSFDRKFLRKYDSVIELKNGSSRVLLVPAYQGRVMTSSCNGDSGYSSGWINYSLIHSGKYQEHINPYGGEERLWLAPEGGQYSFFFAKGVPFDFEHWFTPKEFDTVPFHVEKVSDTSALFSRNMVLKNRSGNVFIIHIDRKITILNNNAIQQESNVIIPNGVKVVAYESTNTITNSGKFAWTRQTGAPAIWLLGMMKPSPSTTIVLPVRTNPSDTTTQFHDTYFGKIPADRWKVEPNIAFLKADGKFRGKVGIPPGHATDFIGSYDSAAHLLTVLQYVSPEFNKEFVNSTWEEQKYPFLGDVFNAYNDGPLKDGSQLGPFYELESLSPAAFLSPGQSLAHSQITYHFQGNPALLNQIAQKLLGTSLQKIETAF